ncbi:hypothetical protein RSOLAG22IIIB_12580 [Rhizoctonia solani]|uniref:3-oxoacyl-[acyl-carrier-protein] reductase FabG n=1 Tax=Rhizoctonia solani TaxID=456999 RepID=A0A0K6GEX4_9AGAM|nr:hypothetical protein RSOLAG22IIIB_12580 [Rhizoctonia solani]
MVANAGIRVPGKPLLEMPEEDFDKIMSVNCKGTLYCYRAAARQMIKQGPERGGRIIGASSTFGLIDSSRRANPIQHFQYGITVNAYAPGPINTPLAASTGQVFIQKMIQQVPLKRMGQPEEVAALVSFIASPGAAYITGQTLSVDGGQIMS